MPKTDFPKSYLEALVKNHQEKVTPRFEDRNQINSELIYLYNLLSEDVASLQNYAYAYPV